MIESIKLHFFRILEIIKKMSKEYMFYLSNRLICKEIVLIVPDLKLLYTN